MEGFSESSAWQPYFPCFIGDLLFLHDDVVPLEGLGACQICHCNKGKVDCKEILDCKEKDCTYKKVFLIHGQTINVDFSGDFSPQQNEQHETCENCQCNNGNVTCHETSECSQKDCIHNKVNILKHGQKIDVDNCSCSCINGGVACDPTCTERGCIYKRVNLIHKQTINVDFSPRQNEHGTCQVCQCNNGNVTCHETLECSEKDCIHNKVNILKNGQMIDIDKCPCSCVNGEVACDPTCTEGEPESSESVYSSSFFGLLPCSYRGIPLLHGDNLFVDDCTICYCYNSTVKCAVKHCEQLWCYEPIKFERECCELCDYCKCSYQCILPIMYS